MFNTALFGRRLLQARAGQLLGPLLRFEAGTTRLTVATGGRVPIVFSDAHSMVFSDRTVRTTLLFGGLQTTHCTLLGDPGSCAYGDSLLRETASLTLEPSNGRQRRWRRLKRAPLHACERCSTWVGGASTHQGTGQLQRADWPGARYGQRVWSEAGTGVWLSGGYGHLNASDTIGAPRSPPRARPRAHLLHTPRLSKNVQPAQRRSKRTQPLNLRDRKFNSLTRALRVIATQACWTMCGCYRLSVEQGGSVCLGATSATSAECGPPRQR